MGKYPVGYRSEYARSRTGTQRAAVEQASAAQVRSRAAVGVIPFPGGGAPNIPRPPGAIIPGIIGAIAAQIIMRYFERGDGEPVIWEGGTPSMTIPSGSGWVHCWGPDWVDPITHQWSFNSGFHDCPPSTPGPLAGQALEGVMTPLASPIPAHFGEYYWLSDNPASPLEAPMKIVAGWVRPAQGQNTDVPRVVPGVVELPARPSGSSAGWPIIRPVGWWGFLTTPISGIGGIPIPRPIGEDVPPIITPFPQSSIWGPRPIARPSRLPVAAIRGQTYILGRDMVWRQTVARSRTLARPAPREKEVKMRIARAGIILKLLGKASEVGDFIESIHKAISKECMKRKARNARYNPATGREWAHRKRWRKSGNKAALRADEYPFNLHGHTPQGRLRDIYRHHDCINWPQAIINVIGDQATDVVYGSAGAVGKEAAKRARDAGYIPDRPGWQVGPWDTVSRDLGKTPDERGQVYSRGQAAKYRANDRNREVRGHL